jgi:hypothetical protein
MFPSMSWGPESSGQTARRSPFFRRQISPAKLARLRVLDRQGDTICLAKLFSRFGSPSTLKPIP